MNNMTSDNFILWLEGFMDGAGKGLSEEQCKIVREKIEGLISQKSEGNFTPYPNFLMWSEDDLKRYWGHFKIDAPQVAVNSISLGESSDDSGILWRGGIKEHTFAPGD